MDKNLSAAIELKIASETGQPHSKIVSARSVGGGCINDAQKIQLADGRRYFVKSNSVTFSKVFQCEATGLKKIASSNTISVPDVVGIGESASESFLVLDWIESNKKVGKKADFSQTIGRQLALLHQTATSDRFGFSSSNFLGSSIQPNDWHEDWIEFWSQCRLGFQLRLAAERGHGGQKLQRLGQRLIDRLPKLISIENESPSLVHGDLWSGNYLAGRHGQPVLFDPAVYYGHREAEFGMTTLFGGFDDNFYAAYNEVFPVSNDSSDRIAIYRLYHLLNHLNLFGISYLDGCLDLLKKFA